MNVNNSWFIYSWLFVYVFILVCLNICLSFYWFNFWNVIFVLEFEEFKNYFKKLKVYRFVLFKEIKEKYKDGGVAIID